MRFSWTSSKSLLARSVLSAVLCGASARAAQPDIAPNPVPEFDSTGILLVQEPPVSQPPPTQPTPEPTLPTPAAIEGLPTVPTNPLGNFPGTIPSDVTGGGGASVASPSGIAVQGGEAAVGLAATDAGSLLGKSLAALGVETLKRQPIANETRIRGYNLGQTLTWVDGQFFFPARQDLDTFLSKVDSGIIKDIVILKGPYSARYGPGFAFIDIQTEMTQRFQNGFEIHGRTVFDYQVNGEQWYGRQSVWGGSRDYGFRVSYGHRTGNDYTDGNGISIPASYNARDVDFAYGVDLSPTSHVEVGYIRLDQTGLEFPGQIFDTTFLKTDAFRARWTLEQNLFDVLRLDAWYNRTVLEGNAQNASKRQQIPALNLLGFTGFTDIDLMTTGARLAGTWGQADEPQLTVGTDFRFIKGQLNEFDMIAGLQGVPCFDAFNFPIPRAHQSVYGGVFLEQVLPIREQLTVRAGARGDWAHTNIDGIPPGFCDGAEFLTTAQDTLGTTNFERNWGMFLGYVTAEYRMGENWRTVAGAGHAQRPPTLTELYAIEPFLAILQQGFTTVRGNPDLRTERLWQLDLGLHANYESWRAGATGFYSWINDYITYQATGDPKQGIINLPRDLTNALTVQFINTDLATLWGGEMYVELDLNTWLTPFATLQYVEGRDRTLDGRNANILHRGLGAQEPLPGIYPLDSRLGLRVHQPGDRPRWAVEGVARVVNHQDRVAFSLGELPTPGFTTYTVRSYWRMREGVLVTLGMENIFDKFYREHLDLRTGRGVFQPGRNTYAGLELRY